MLKGDIKEFSRHMQAADTGQAVWEALRTAVTEHAARCLWTEVSEGDAVIIAHDDPNALINVALAAERGSLRGAGPAAAARRAGSRSRCALDEAGDGRVVVLGGEPLRRAARIEPHVAPGEIWGDRGVPRRRSKRARRATRRHPSRRTPDGGVPMAPINVRKPGSNEPDIWVRLFRIEPRRHGG